MQVSARKVETSDNYKYFSANEGTVIAPRDKHDIKAYNAEYMPGLIITTTFKALH